MKTCVIVRKAAIQAGIWQEGFSAHALRRFFQTSLESSGMNRNWIMRMMGHKLRGVEGSYSKPEIEMLREAYQKNYQYLAITETAEQRSRVEALENQVERLLLNNKRKDDEIKRLETELALTTVSKDDLKERINHTEEKLEKERRNKEGLKDRIHRTEEKLVDLTKMVEKLIENSS